MSFNGRFTRENTAANHLPMWREGFAAIEAALLHVAPVYWGLGAPHGDSSAVILLPGFLCGDSFLVELWAWLYRMDYKPYYAGMGVNAECPNLLIRRSLNATIDRALDETGRKVHMIGHSLGGVIAMAAAVQRPNDVASVITLASPFRGATCHPNILRMADYVGRDIRRRHGAGVLPDCYTGKCGCAFVDSLVCDFPSSVDLTTMYTKTDAIVDWQFTVTGDPAIDVEVPGTHIGLVFNPSVYMQIARRLSASIGRAVQAEMAQRPVA